FTDAYVDRLLLNVYAGPGLADVWIDDVEIGPVIDTTAATTPTVQPTARVKLLPPAEAGRKASRTALVEMDRGQLLVNGKPFFFRGIRHSDTPLQTLREAGFNTVWLDPTASPALIEQAATLGLWLVPALPARSAEAAPTSADGLRQEMANFLGRDNTLFWDIGSGLTEEQSAPVMATLNLVHAADPQRPIAADAW